MIFAALAQPGTTATPQGAPYPESPTAAPAKNRLVLAGGTRVPMRTITAVSSLKNREGDRFDLYVSEDVVVDGYIVIPRGSRAIGEITYLDTKGGFGKSGKMNVALLWIDASGVRIPLDGKMGLRGESGTGPTVATALLVGINSFLVTGKSATLAAGTEAIGRVARDLPVELHPATVAGNPVPPFVSSSPSNAP